MMQNRHRVFSAAMGCVLLLCAKASADIPTERIEQAGFAPERLQKISEILRPEESQVPSRSWPATVNWCIFPLKATLVVMMHDRFKKIPCFEFIP